MDFFFHFHSKRSEITAFTFDRQGFFGNDNNQIIITDELFLLAILNSTVSKFFLSNICDFVRGGFVRLKISYVQQVPIPPVSENQKTSLESLVTNIFYAKKADHLADIYPIEKEIDHLIYELYGLTKEEIRIVEGECIGNISLRLE